MRSSLVGTRLAVRASHVVIVAVALSIAALMVPAGSASAGSASAPSASVQTSIEIGKTSTGDPVFLETKSVKRANGIVTAAVRARFAKPTKASMGDLYASRTIAMFDCAKQLVAIKENWYYLDQAGKKIGNHKVVGIPGYGPAFKGSVPDVALRHLCAAK